MRRDSPEDIKLRNPIEIQSVVLFEHKLAYFVSAILTYQENKQFDDLVSKCIKEIKDIVS